ncbi:Uncharacterised protein [Mycobacteroides abscessus subsp. bolletii]|uniref:hypothetical protein n=1 Tax=Mycobacteroides abscessus TaxID=36809 RepID=UPI0009A7CAEE|nr:hypothetical protein [Mycobacteroides abscessus]SLB51870.1 Uncharacterised protein [Mycobacteroides abscessus subsp. bolletii]
MTTIDKDQAAPLRLMASIERGLDRMLTNPAQRLNRLRQELEREQTIHRHRVAEKSRETVETLEVAASYLRTLSRS